MQFTIWAKDREVCVQGTGKYKHVAHIILPVQNACNFLIDDFIISPWQKLSWTTTIRPPHPYLIWIQGQSCNPCHKCTLCTLSLLLDWLVQSWSCAPSTTSSPSNISVVQQLSKPLVLFYILARWHVNCLCGACGDASGLSAYFHHMGDQNIVCKKKRPIKSRI